MASKLSDKQTAALNLELAEWPHNLSLNQIAKRVGVDSRTLHRWRKTDAWAAARKDKDTDEIRNALRAAVLEKREAQLFKVYLDRYGDSDGDLTQSMLSMTESEAREIAKDATAWLKSLE